jgi:hypothetical protein
MARTATTLSSLAFATYPISESATLHTAVLEVSMDGDTDDQNNGAKGVFEKVADAAKEAAQKVVDVASNAVDSVTDHTMSSTAKDIEPLKPDEELVVIPPPEPMGIAPMAPPLIVKVKKKRAKKKVARKAPAKAAKKSKAKKSKKAMPKKKKSKAVAKKKAAAKKKTAKKVAKKKKAKKSRR